MVFVIGVSNVPNIWHLGSLTFKVPIQVSLISIELHYDNITLQCLFH